MNAVLLVIYECRDFGIDQASKWRRTPLIVGDLVMRAGKGMDALINDLDEIFDRRFVGRLRLTDQAADQRQYVAYPMIELGDQQFLAFRRCLALHAGLVRQSQHHFDQGRPQGLGDAQLGHVELLRLAFDQLLPFGETLARMKARTVGTIFDRLLRIAGPAHRMDQLTPEKDDVIARAPADRNGEHARGLRSEVGGIEYKVGNVIGRKHPARSHPVQRLDDLRKCRRVRGLAGEGVIAVDPYPDAIGRNRTGQDVAEPVGVVEQGLVRCHRAEQLVRNVARATLIFDDPLSLARFDVHREHLGE